LKFELIIKDGPRDVIIEGQEVATGFDIRRLIEVEQTLSLVLGLRIHIVEAQLTSAERSKWAT
jgi:hypothetical protein